VNPVAAALFSGLILIVLIYSTLDLTGLTSRWGAWGAVLPLPVIGGLMYCIFLGMKGLRRHRTVIRAKGPLYLRLLMKSCLERTCGELDTRLSAPEVSSAAIFNAILLDKTLYIGATDCVRYSDIRRQIEGSGLKGTDDLVLSRFFQTFEEYTQQALPVEIRQVEDLVARSRSDLQSLLNRLKSAHEALFSGAGDVLVLLPPDPKKTEKISSSYRFTPPSPQSAQRMAFALETLAYLKAVRYKSIKSTDRRRYDAAADEGIPKLGSALKDYKQAWRDLVDAYEQPRA
jgi:hypothetical protein